MSVKLLTEHHLRFLSLKGGSTGLSESTLVKMAHCWKSHALAHYYVFLGAIRLELCSNLVEGGTTPSLGNYGGLDGVPKSTNH